MMTLNDCPFLLLNNGSAALLMEVMLQFRCPHQDVCVEQLFLFILDNFMLSEFQKILPKVIFHSFCAPEQSQVFIHDFNVLHQ